MRDISSDPEIRFILAPGLCSLTVCMITVGIEFIPVFYRKTKLVPRMKACMMSEHDTFLYILLLLLRGWGGGRAYIRN